MRTWTRISILSLLALAAIGCGAVSNGSLVADADGRGSSKGTEGILAERGPAGELLLTFQVRDVESAALMQSIGELAETRVLPDPTIPARVSLCVERQPWRAALNAVAKELLCRIVDDPPNIRVITPACNPPLALEGADLCTVVRLLAAMLERRVEIPRELQGEVSRVFSMKSRAAVRVAFDALVTEHGFQVNWPDPCTAEPIRVIAR